MRRSFQGLVILCLAGGVANPAFSAGFSIDPDPASPTLGEVLDREARLRRAASVPVVATPAPRISAVPAIPQNAATVIVPGTRNRIPQTRR
jgi:hypothetical protein